MTVPFLSCLCPTYRRPQLLANSLACWLAQDYPLERRELIILDDSGQLSSQTGAGWELISLPRRFRTLPEKYNALAALADRREDALVIWEDDDIYLPWYLKAHATALAACELSKPSKVLSMHTGVLSEYPGEGYFHASMAFSKELLTRVNGWSLTRRGDFDLQLIRKLTTACPASDPCRSHPPGYIYRWTSTGEYHGQSFMRSPDDETWYDRVPEQTRVPSLPIPFQSQFDPETHQILEIFAP